MARPVHTTFLGVLAVATALPLLAVAGAAPALAQGYPSSVRPTYPAQQPYPGQPAPGARTTAPEFDDLDDEDLGAGNLPPPGPGMANSPRFEQRPYATQPSYNTQQPYGGQPAYGSQPSYGAQPPIGSQQQQAYPSNQPYPYPPNQQAPAGAPPVVYGNQQPGGVIAPDANAANPNSMRPPGEVNGTIAAPGAPQQLQPGQQGQPMQLSALPPEDQPETGPVKELPPHLKRQEVSFQTKEPVGTIIVDTSNTHLYLVLGNGRAMRYGVRVGRDGFTWSGTQRISRKAEWPDWHPPAEMIERQPYLPRFMAGGEGNPMGAAALYLGSTVYRIHGTNQPSTIGQFVSSGCVGMLNEDVQDLFARVKVGTRVVVWPGKAPANVAGAPAQGQVAGPATPVPPGAAQAARNDLPWSQGGVQPGAALPPLPTQTIR